MNSCLEPIRPTWQLQVYCFDLAFTRTKFWRPIHGSVGVIILSGVEKIVQECDGTHIFKETRQSYLLKSEFAMAYSLTGSHK
jgi:hypothetical protein